MSVKSMISRGTIFFRDLLTRPVYWYNKILGRWSDKHYLLWMFENEMGYRMDFNTPRTFDEKLNWQKLYDRNPAYVNMVDKCEVKKWVSSVIGEKYVIPLLGVWSSFDDIDFEKLPSQFVLKCTHDSGSTIICKDKENFDWLSAKEKLTKALGFNWYDYAKEWAYKDIPPRIIAEAYIEDNEDCELRDYKFYCFNGVPRRLLLATDRQKKDYGPCFDYFDMEFNHLNMTNHWHPQAKEVPHKPKHWDEMKQLAAKLSEGLPQVRVDFYEANDKILFGEMTFYDQAGFLKIHPDDWNEEFGSWIKLPPKNK